MQSGGLRRFAYIGTAYACGDQQDHISEKPFDTTSEFSNIYEQTKWEAERYLYLLYNDLPLDIFRPSIIVGDSQTGIINDFNVLYVPLRLILTGRIRILPCRPDIPLDIVPLDYVADCITDVVFGSKDRTGSIYHIVAGPEHEVGVGDIIDAATRCVESRNPAISVGRVKYLPSMTSGIRMAGFISSGTRFMSVMREYLPYFTTVRHFENKNLRAMLSDSIRQPRFDSYFGNLMRYFIDEDLGRRLRAAA
jgi:long-chain acyl-CoA synthetase